MICIPADAGIQCCASIWREAAIDAVDTMSVATVPGNYNYKGNPAALKCFPCHSVMPILEGVLGLKAGDLS